MTGEDFRAAMSHQAGAVAIITVGAAGARTGLTATAVASVSDDPPTLLVCVNKTASAHAPIAARRAFGVNFLARQHEAIAAQFAGATGVRGEARFAVGDWSTARTGAPILADAAASLDCEVLQQVDAVTHSVFIGAVRAARHTLDAPPLVYFRSKFYGLDGCAPDA